MNIEMGKKYTTRDGRAVRILAIIKNDIWPVLGVIVDTDGAERGFSWHADGRYDMYIPLGDEPEDLIPVPTKHEGWALVDMLAPSYTTRAEAERAFDEGKYAVGPTGNSRYRIAFYTWEET